MSKKSNNAMWVLSLVKRDPGRYETQEQVARELDLPLPEVRQAIRDLQVMVPTLHPGYVWESKPFLRITRQLSVQERVNKRKYLRSLANCMERTATGLGGEDEDAELLEIAAKLREFASRPVFEAKQAMEDIVERDKNIA